jgi:3-isopropylmalate/(R)-2-methylmalate dehydratase large subunit
MIDKIWDRHVVCAMGEGTDLLYIDRHLVHEVSSPQAFESLRVAGRRVRRPDATLAVADHNVPTSPGRQGADEDSLQQLAALEANVAAFDVPYIPIADPRQGIVHIVGPEQGLSLPGMTIVCGDSHTSTHGAFGALAFGIGTSEVEHVLATQSLVQKRPKTLRLTIDGALGAGASAKDLALFVMGRLGAAGGNGHVIEYAGAAVRALDMAGRMTLCNMSIECGARAGLVAPDETTFAYLEGRPFAPTGAAFEAAKIDWLLLRSDLDCRFDLEVRIDAAAVQPMVTWGVSPDAAIPIGGTAPDPAAVALDARQRTESALDYMGIKPGQKLSELTVDVVFIGSCTNGRIEDLREVARIAAGRAVAPGVRAMIVPGSGLVKRQAEAEGLDRIFLEAGFEWREPGCSMCLAMNPDRLEPGQRCASTSNRNFQGRQGAGGRTHLVSPAMAAAAAVTGHLTDVRELG